MPFLSTLSLRRATPVSRCYHKCIQNFYPRSPCGERRLPICKYGLPLIFLSTLSLRRATDSFRVVVGTGQHFYPRSPCGERQFSYFLHIHRLLFLSTLSLRRATAQIAPFFRNNRNFYPRSPCGERRKIKDFVYLYNFISIHALLAESDGILVFCGPQGSGFLSTLSLRRATLCRRLHSNANNVFLSTLSLRRATPTTGRNDKHNMNFYPRSPCGERLGLIFYFVCCIIISIHALLAESDQAKALKVSTLSNFYPRSPCGERRKLLVSDCQQQYFYPRSPCGERRRNRKLILIIRHFYPRSPCGERPKNTSIAGRITSISIHALLAESDESKLPSESHTRNFYPRSATNRRPIFFRNFYPRSPCGERPDETI